MRCPVCEGDARDITPPDFDGVVLRCVNCKDYDIATGYMERLLRLDLEDRARVLRKAKGFAGTGRPSINSMCF
jgi:hypothetical protein